MEDYAGGMRAPPQHRIPHTSPGLDTSSVQQVSEDEEVQELEEVDDLGRSEKRRMFLLGLRNLVPELRHAPIESGQSSGHFSLLNVQDKIIEVPGLVFVKKILIQHYFE